MDFDYLKILVTTVLAVFGWLIAHHFTAQRTLAAKRRDITLEHLINAYRILSNDISHRTLDSDRNRTLEDLLADIQLFGSTEQVDLARAMVDEVAAGQSFELDPLINELRDDLRNQLQLPPIDGYVRWLRFDNPSDKPPTE